MKLNSAAIPADNIVENKNIYITNFDLITATSTSILLTFSFISFK